MPLNVAPCELPVLLLYNLDPSWTAREQAEVIAASERLGEALAAVGHPTTLAAVTSRDLTAILARCDPLTCVVLNWCEGFPGLPHSDALVARELELRGFTFTGASSDALAFCEDKRRIKRALERAGLPTPTWRVYDRAQADGWNKFPAIVKLVNEHCSEGLTRESVVLDERELCERIAYVLDRYRQPALVEEFIDGREFHVSLWGNGQVSMLPPAEMDFSLFSEVRDRLCTYEAKFVPGSPHYEGIRTLLPAPLSAEELCALERVCKAAYALMGCRDYGRVDVRYRDGLFYVLDVNPNADLCADASFACAAEVAGYSYGEVGSRIVRLAARRHPSHATRR